MKKLYAIAACTVLPALAAFSPSVQAADGFKLTSSELTITVTDTNLTDGIAAGYTPRNLDHGGSVKIYDNVVVGAEWFNADTPDVVPMDALADYESIHAYTAVTGKLGGITMELSASDGIAAKTPRDFFDGSYDARQSFVLQPHTTLTFTGSYAYERPYTSAIPVEGGEVWILPSLHLSIFTSQAGTSIFDDFRYSMERHFTFQLTNDSDIASEQYVRYVSYADLRTQFNPVSSVPEPATWGMMGLGLGLLALRHRRQRDARS